MKQVKVVMVLTVDDFILKEDFEKELGDVFASDSHIRFEVDKIESFWEVSEPIVSGRMQVLFSGKVIGFPLRGESKRMTEARLLIEAEQRVNQIGDIRAHIDGEK